MCPDSRCLGNLPYVTSDTLSCKPLQYLMGLVIVLMSQSTVKVLREYSVGLTDMACQGQHCAPEDVPTGTLGMIWKLEELREADVCLPCWVTAALCSGQGSALPRLDMREPPPPRPALEGCSITYKWERGPAGPASSGVRV